MIHRMSCVGLVLLLGAVRAAAQSPRVDSPALDEKLLERQGLPGDGPRLLELFTRRTPDAATIRHFKELLAQCGSDAYDERVAASEELTQLGATVRPLLLRALHAPPVDREVLHRIDACLRTLPPDRDGPVVMAAARQLARRHAKAALPVLLNYLPYACDNGVRQEVQRAVNALAARYRTDAVLRAALKDADSLKRAAAGEALGRAGAPVAALLRDAEPRVRLQVGLALAGRGEREAIPVLIALLAQLPTEQAWTAQEGLLRLPGTDELPVLDGSQAAGRVAAAWTAWWQQHGAAVNLAALAGPPAGQGRLLISSAGTGVNNAKVVELDRDKKPVREITGLRYPVDVQPLGRDHVLITEYLGRRVTERDGKGNIVWQYPGRLLIGSQRLPGGRTFIASRQQLVIVDRQGREAFVYQHTGPSIQAAQRLHDGHLIFATAGGTCHILEPQGREVKQFRIGQVYTMGTTLEVLPGGRILVPLYIENVVAEYDFEGRRVWEAKVQRPTSAVRLPNGNTLVASYLNSRIVELAPDGREVWSYTTEGRPWRARPR